MSDLIHDINVKYINSTGQNNFMVVVFTKNENVNAINTPFVAWHTLKAQSSSSFVYPVQAAVAAYWEYPSGVKNTAGPFDSDLGSTWTMSTLTMESSPNLKQDLAAQANPDHTIVVKNVKPTAWAGVPFNFGLYKSGKLLVTQENVGVNSQAVFQLTPKLFFGVVKDIRVGEIFKSLTITQALFEVDLLAYSNGLVVQLDLNQASGEFHFTAGQPTM